MTRNIKLLNSQVAELVDARIAQMVTNAVRLVRFQQSLRKYNSYRFESYNELKALLVKYGAELTIEDFGKNWVSDEKIVVDFKFDESLFEKENTGIIPQLVLGRWEDGL